MLTLRLEDIIENGNVRLDTGDVTGLADSIGRHGLLQPILVVATSPDEDNTTYTLVAGARRLKALRLLGYETTDAVLNEELTQPDHVIAAQFHENDQRVNLTPYEEAQVAWDLKLEGNKQAEVAVLMGKSNADVSKLHKIAKHLAAGDVDAARATQMTADGLLDVAEYTTTEVAGDAIRLIVSGEASSVQQAGNMIERELRTVEFYDSIAIDQKLWADMGVLVVMENPQYKDGSRYERANNVKTLRDLGIVLDKHIELDCHRVYISTDGYKPEVHHFCMDAKSHTPTKTRKPEVVSPSAKKDMKQRTEKSTERRDRKAAKEVRFKQAAIWMQERTNAAEREEIANRNAIEGKWRTQHTHAALNLLNLMGDRPKNAEYTWYSDTFLAWCDETFKTPLQRDRWQVRFLDAFEFIDMQFNHRKDSPIADIVLPVEEPDGE